jgi:tripartite-type tricarboxylate transporter receptor subunit TctC
MFRFIAAAIALALAASNAQSAAAEYPDRPIRFIAGASPGSTSDIIARVVATELSAQMHQQVIVDNRPGAAGVVSLDLIVKAPADGYTIGYYGTTMVTLRELYPRLSYDPVKDVQMVAQLVSGRQLLLVPSASPFHSVQALIDHAKANPGKLYYASGGNGSTNHLSGELFKLMTGTNIVQVPYKTIQQVIADLTGGRVHWTLDNLASGLPFVRSGRLRALGVSSATRLPAMPELPTIAEAGVPGFEVSTWSGIVLPLGVSNTLVARLNAEVNKAITSTVMKEKVGVLGYGLVGGTSQQFDAFVKKEVVKWTDVIKRTGAKVD